MIPGDAEIHEPLMSAAFELARRGIGRVAPNPPVGAILINDELQVAEGWHAEYGGPHAEAACLAAARSAGIETRGSTMIVTLEPCGHEGKIVVYLSHFWAFAFQSRVRVIQLCV